MSRDLYVAKNDSILLSLILITKLIVLVVAEAITPTWFRLGDTPKYLSSLTDFQVYYLLSSTDLMKFTGSIVGKLPSPFYHLPACLLSWYGIRFFYFKLRCTGFVGDNNFHRLIFFIFFSLPSFSLWSSVHSKEAVGVFFTSVLAGLLASFVYERRLILSLKEFILFFLSLYLLLIFKPQYIIPVFSVFSFLSITSVKPFTTVTSKVSVFSVMILLQLILLVLSQGIIDSYAFTMHSHFDTDIAQSTRENIFFLEGDFFLNAPYGMAIAFYGPSLYEATLSWVKMTAFIESYILCLLCVPLLFPVLSRRIKVDYVIVAVLLVFWLLFVHYPFGVFNPGSAVRYRANFLPLMFFSVLLMANGCDKKRIRLSRFVN